MTLRQGDNIERTEITTQDTRYDLVNDIPVGTLYHVDDVQDFGNQDIFAVVKNARNASEGIRVLPAQALEEPYFTKVTAK